VTRPNVLPLFSPRGTVMPADVAPMLKRAHYLGPSSRGLAYYDSFGVMVVSNPSSRRLPQHRWLELARWCIESEIASAGSRQWRLAARWMREVWDTATTVVSYSDPSIGHTGALYRACNWLWAPTWHRLRPPPTGNGAWSNSDSVSSVKDRWIFPLRRDVERESLLALHDAGLRAQFPWAEYREPVWHGVRPSGGGGDFRRWCDLVRGRRVA